MNELDLTVEMGLEELYNELQKHEALFLLEKAAILEKSERNVEVNSLRQKAKNSLTERERQRDKDAGLFSSAHQEYAFAVHDLAVLVNDIVAAEAPDKVVKYAIRKQELLNRIELVKTKETPPRKLLVEDVQAISDSIVVEMN